MVGKQENTARTLVRMEVIILQGLLMGIIQFVIGIATIPVMPFAVMCNRWRADVGHGFFARVCHLPLWFLSGCLYAVIAPFETTRKTIADLRAVVSAEWATRNLEDNPLKPNGHPLQMPTAEQRAIRHLAHTLWVIRDYNGEARRFGQGLPIDESRL